VQSTTARGAIPIPSRIRSMRGVRWGTLRSNLLLAKDSGLVSCSRNLFWSLSDERALRRQRVRLVLTTNEIEFQY
jgi:hypothetical protein